MVNPAKSIDFEIRYEFSASNSPFLVENESEYQRWKKAKLERYSRFNSQRIIKIADYGRLSTETLNEFANQLNAFNYAFFELDTANRELSTHNFLTLGQQFGLNRIDANPGSGSDGVTLLSVVDSADKRSRYIPYTNRALSWHTDGYYNPISSRIDAFTLYCVNQAGQGGDNFMLDHEMVYMQIRDTDPDLLVALMDSTVMEVPANISNHRVIRRAESGPVFIVDSETGRLNMRYSARPQNIAWKTDVLSRRAVNLVRELLVDSEYITGLKLESGQGIVCNNVLHGRGAFLDSAAGESSRLYYRARYYDAVTFPAADGPIA